MNTPNPYDLSEAAIRKIRERKRERIQNPRKNNSRTISPYDLTAHGGLTALAAKAKLRKKF